MGEVWRARHRLLARRSAIKLIRPETLGGDEASRSTVVARFEREAQATASLRSPHTVELYDFGVSDTGAFYYALTALVRMGDKVIPAFEQLLRRPNHDPRKIARILGPRGLMPNPKTGTVTTDPPKAIKEVKAGRVDYKLDKSGNVSAAIGKASFSPEQLVENAEAMLESVSKAKPPSAKGNFIQNVTIAAAMCPGMKLDTSAFNSN